MVKAQKIKLLEVIEVTVSVPFFSPMIQTKLFQ